MEGVDMAQDTGWKLPDWVTARGPREKPSGVRAEQERRRADARWAIPYRLRWEAMVANDLRCAYCAGQGDKFLAPDGRPWHVDHHIPLSRGGPVYDAEFSVVCGRCNNTKRTRTLEELREWLLVCDETPHRLAMRAVLCG
jgi:5-methylcytosine-specific restriction endonuclease McrA